MSPNLHFLFLSIFKRYLLIFRNWRGTLSQAQSDDTVASKLCDGLQLSHSEEKILKYEVSA